MLQWNYKSNTEKSTGYEDILDDLKSYTKEKYKNATEEEKTKMIEDVFKIYRRKNIFPIQYYNQEGIYNEISKCINKKVSFKDNVLDLKFNQGQSLCRFLFPNLTKTICKKANTYTLYDKFYNDHKLKMAIRFCLLHKTTKHPCLPSAIKDGLEMLGGAGVATNFKTMNAKALYEKYCPPNGIIYDYACGFGGRMLGALSSKNNYIYIGVEPCLETYTHLNELGLCIEHVTQRENSYKIFCMGSEDYLEKENSIDFAFSSPPYFNLEQYSDEPTQCYNKFPILEDWFKGYVEPTIQNTYKMLKPNAYYAVNIADFKIKKNKVAFVDRWIELAQEIGFKYIEQIYMKLQTRRGYGHDNTNQRNKKEGIFILKK